MAVSSRTSSLGKDQGGEFLNQNRKFLGFRFVLDSQVYYGWARFTIKSSDFRIGYELIDFAYQTTSGVPIYAGEGIQSDSAAPLGALAFGDAAIQR